MRQLPPKTPIKTKTTVLLLPPSDVDVGMATPPPVVMLRPKLVVPVVKLVVPGMPEVPDVSRLLVPELPLVAVLAIADVATAPLLPEEPLVSRLVVPEVPPVLFCTGSLNSWP